MEAHCKDVYFMAGLIRRLLSGLIGVPRRSLVLVAQGVSIAASELGYLLAHFRSPWQAELHWPAHQPVFTGRVAIFAHDDKNGTVRDYVLTHLQGLRDAGCQVVFVSNCEELDELSLAALKPFCTAILVRRNWGGKWGAWREGLHHLGEDTDLSLLLLVDDSTYGPLWPLAPALEALDFTHDDVLGWTESWQDRWHLQSYFLAVHPRVLSHPAWHKFWSGCRPVRSPRILERTGEIAFSQTLLRAGLRMQVRLPLIQLIERVDRTLIEYGEPDEGLLDKLRYWQVHKIDTAVSAHKPFDPTQLLWRQLLQLQHPYFSRRLLRENPEVVHDLFDWKKELDKIPEWDRSLIDEDLATPLGRRRTGPDWSKPLKTAYRSTRSYLGAAYRRCFEDLSMLRSRLRNHRQVRVAWPDGPVAAGRRVVVFVHFDKYGLVREYVLHYLRVLREAGVSILFVSNSGKLVPAAMEALKPLCFGILVRANVGYDFGAWREGLEYLRGSLDDLEWLAIANDSVYGPLTPLAPLLDQMDFTKADVWGFTDSPQRNWHLQSYFMAFSKRVLRSKAWRDFWRGIHPVGSKSWAITNGELKISGALKKAGFDCAALFPYEDLLVQFDPVKRIANRGASPFTRLRLRHRHNLTQALEKGYTLNPTAELWRQLLRRGFPFLKRELLRVNPTGVPDSLDWQTELTTASRADVRLIEDDLRKSVRGRVA